MTTAPGTPALLRILNDRAVLAAVVDGGSVTVAELVALTGLSKPTVAQALRRLQEQESIAIDGTTSGSSGPAAQRYGPGAAVGVAVGMEIRRGWLTAVAQDITGTELARVRRRCPEPGAVAQVLAGLADLGVTDIVGSLVVALPATYDHRNDQVRHANRLTGWMTTGVAADIADALPGARVDLENDAKLLAVAEQESGAGRGCAAMVLLYSGTGLASAAIVDGVLHRGFGGAAGEIGYLDGVVGPGAVQDQLGPGGVLSLGRSLGLHFTAAATLVAHAAQHGGGAAAVEFLDELGRRYARLAAVLIAVLDPQRLVLAGPLPAAGGEALRAAVSKHLKSFVLQDVPVVSAQVAADPVLTGAAHRARQQLRYRLFDSVGTLDG